MTWVEEWSLIKAAAFKYGLDAHFIGAIRRVENGREPGCEFGVLGVAAPTYADQLRVACAVIKHRLLQYNRNVSALFMYIAPNGDEIVIYSPLFISWFASNFPLEPNWAARVKYTYVHLLDAEHQRVSTCHSLDSLSH